MLNSVALFGRACNCMLQGGVAEATLGRAVPAAAPVPAVPPVGGEGVNADTEDIEDADAEFVDAVGDAAGDAFKEAIRETNAFWGSSWVGRLRSSASSKIKRSSGRPDRGLDPFTPLVLL